MSIRLFPNELSSLADRDIAECDAVRLLRQFVGVVIESRKICKSVELHRPNKDEPHIGKCYPLRKLRNLRDCRDDVRRILAIADKTSSLFCIYRPDEDYEYFFGGKPAYGLGYAHLHDGIAVSLAHDDCWRQGWIDIVYRRLAETEEGEDDLVDEPVSVRHASCREHLVCHKPFLHEQCTQALLSGVDLWNERENHFPNLRFLPRVEKQMQGLDHKWVKQVKKRLFELQAAAKQWQSGQGPLKDYMESKTSGEGERRKEICWFTDDDGNKRCFDLHIRFTPGAGRINFGTGPDRKCLIVAYIGRKLDKKESNL